MKIAFDATALYGRFGGIENALWHTFAGLRALDSPHEFLVFVPRDAPAAPFPDDARWTWQRLPFDGAHKMRRIAWQQGQLPLWLRQQRCDLLHAWNYVAPLLCCVPTVLTVQDLIALDHSRYATRFNRWHYRAVMPRGLRRAARVLVTTDATKAAVLRRAPRAAVRVVPLGIEPLFFEPVSPVRRDQLRAKYDLPPRFTLYVGNFEPKKNLPNLLRALRMLPDAPPLVIAGGIKPWPGIERQLRGVQRLGFVPRDELPVLYAMCAAFCFPSLCEGFGLPVLEALACGAPTLASTRVPLPQLETVAACCEPRYPRSVAHHLEKLLQEAPANASATSSASAAQRRAYAAPFTWNETARRTLAVYEELG